MHPFECLSTNNGLVSASNLFNNVKFIWENCSETSQIRQAYREDSLYVFLLCSFLVYFMNHKECFLEIKLLGYFI